MGTEGTQIGPDAPASWKGLLASTGHAEAQRAWVADRMIELAPLVRNRLRRKLSGSARRLFDSQDLMSTVLRRVDRLAAEGRLRAQSDGELIALLLRVSDRVVIDRYRAMARLRRVEGEDGQWAQSLLVRLDRGDESEASETLTRLFQSLESADDRALLSLWLREVPSAVIAETIGISPDALRQRWRTLRTRLHGQVA